MKIAVGNSRMDKKWKNRDISWEDLCARVGSTIRTTETVEEYRKLKKGAQDNIKDVGGFVGGQLREGRRKNGMVLCRSMLTLDMDYGKPGVWDEIDLLHDFQCCVYSTHKHTPEHIINIFKVLSYIRIRKAAISIKTGQMGLQMVQKELISGIFRPQIYAI